MNFSPAFQKLQESITPSELQLMLDSMPMYKIYTKLKISDQLLTKYINFHHLRSQKAFRQLRDLDKKERDKIITEWTDSLITKRKLAEKYAIGSKVLNKLLKENNVLDRVKVQTDVNWHNYRRLVHRLTHTVRRHYGLTGKEGYDWDHKFSVNEGYKQNIPPYIIASRENLELIPLAENRANGRDCSISRNELFSSLGLSYVSINS